MFHGTYQGVKGYTIQIEMHISPWRLISEASLPADGTIFLTCREMEKSPLRVGLNGVEFYYDLSSKYHIYT